MAFENQKAIYKITKQLSSSKRTFCSFQVIKKRLTKKCSKVSRNTEVKDEKALLSVFVHVCVLVMSQEVGEKGGRLFVPTQSLWTSSSHQCTQQNAASLSAVCSSQFQFLH